jgi:hypothetical protein
MVFFLSGEHHIPELNLVHRRRNNHVWYRPHVSNIEHAMMRGSVGTNQAASIETKNNLQVLERDIVNYLIIGPLHER